MTRQNQDDFYPGASRRANDLEEGRWGQRIGKSQLHEYHGYGGDPVRGKSLPYEPDYDRTMLVANVPTLVGGAESGPLTVYWPHGGLVVAMAVSVTGLPLDTIYGSAMSNFAIKVTVGDGRESLFVQGGTSGATSDAYTSFVSLCGANNERRFLLKRPVYPTLSWTVELKNIGASESGLQAEVVFFLDSDPGDVRRHFYKSIAVPKGTLVEVYSQSDQGTKVIDTGKLR